MKENIQKICLVCGKEFTTTKSIRKYCSRECSKYFHESQKKAIRQKAREGLKCEVCGVLIGGNRRRRFCSQRCVNKARDLRQSALPKPKEPKKSIKPKLSISEVNALARMENLTYGQYLSKYKV